MKTIQLQQSGGAYRISPNDVWYPTADQIAAGEIRGDMTHHGLWQIITGYKALAVSGKTWESEPLTVYGWRALSKPRESGHDLEGRVSVGGKQYRGFTSSVLLELDNGRLINVAAIHVCL